MARGTISSSQYLIFFTDEGSVLFYTIVSIYSSVCSNSANNLAVERLVTNTHRPDMALSSSSCANSTQLVRVEEESESMTSSVTATVATQGQADGEEGGNGLRVAGDTYKLMQPHAQASLGYLD